MQAGIAVVVHDADGKYQSTFGIYAVRYGSDCGNIEDEGNNSETSGSLAVCLVVGEVRHSGRRQPPEHLVSLLADYFLCRGMFITETSSKGVCSSKAEDVVGTTTSELCEGEL